MSSTSVYREDAFLDRINFAASAIARGRNTTRSFDTCFEMSDGDAVAAALVRRARKKPSGRLAQNLYRYITKSSAEEAYEATKHLSDEGLVKCAAKERARARNEFAARMEKRRTAEAAVKAAS